MLQPTEPHWPGQGSDFIFHFSVTFPFLFLPEPPRNVGIQGLTESTLYLMTESLHLKAVCLKSLALMSLIIQFFLSFNKYIHKYIIHVLIY